MKKLLVSISFVLAFCATAQSQYSLSFAEGGIISVDTAEYNSLIPIEFYLINSGIDTIFSNISIDYIVNPSSDESEYLTLINVLFYIIFSEQDPFAPGDSFYFNSFDNSIIVDDFFIEVNQEKNFNVGDNIIIVWPSILIDDLNDDIIVNMGQYIKEIYVPQPLRLHSSDKLDFKLFHHGHHLRIESLKALDKIRVFSINGTLVYSGKEALIPTYHLSKGIYVFHVQFSSGEFQTGRVFIND
jgi:hypothetical protein